MADVTVNIRANASGAVNDLNNAGRGVTNPPQSPVTPPTPPGGTPPVTPPQQPPVNPNTNTPAIPAYDRMAQDIRREMLSRGALMVPGSSNFNQLMAAVQQQQRTAAYKQIDDRYTQGVTQTQQELENKRKIELDRLEQERQDKLSKVVTPNAAQRINDQYDRRIERLHDSIEIEKATAFTQLGQERDNDKAKVEQDLARIAAELVQELRQGNPNSYLGKLRQQYQEATWRRDNAETEDEAQAAGAEAATIQRRMSRAMTPVNRLAQMGSIVAGANQVLGIVGAQVGNVFANTSSQISEINSAANGDMFAAMSADLQRNKTNATIAGAVWGAGIGGVLGAIIAAAGSYGVGTVGGGLLGAGIGGGFGSKITETIWNWQHGKEQNLVEAGQMWQQQEQRIQQYNDFALAIRRRGGDLGTTREDLMYLMNPTNMSRYDDANNQTINYYDLGYTGSQFSVEAANRIKQRGFIDKRNDNYRDYRSIVYATQQIALERAYNMSSGSLSQYSGYDRYSSVGHNNDANKDVANLVASLDKRGVLGMSNGLRLRSNEFLNYQTQLMEMQKGWMDAPNANYATKLLLAGQNAFGNNFDSRAINEIGQIESTVTRPKEDYSKALLYDVIQDIMPETKGNLLAIRQAQYSDDPNVRMKIQQAMANRIQEVYGGLDTISGYLAASHYYSIEDPERLRKIISQYQKGIHNISVETGDVSADVASLKGYTPENSKAMLGYQDETVLSIQSSLGNLNELAGTMLSDFNQKLQEIINKVAELNQ